MQKQKIIKESERKEESAIFAYDKWIRNGKKTKNNCPDLGKEDLVAIVRVLMPKIAPNLKLGDFTTMRECCKWLGSLAQGTTWEDETDAA